MASKLFKDLDWLLLTVMVVLILVGMITIYSTSLHPGSEAYRSYLFRQMAWVGIGLVILLITLTVDYQVLDSLAYYFYFTGMVVLAIVLWLGQESHGAQRWLGFLGLRGQPSELAKVVVLLAAARYLDDSGDKITTLRRLAGFLLLVAVPILLIFLQPNLGTALVIVPMVLVMLYVGGARTRHLATLVALALASTPLFWPLIKDYQKARLLSFLKPDLDPLGSSYQLIQSKIALGSGRILGKGWSESTQSQLNFIPAHHTDFIFSVFGEQWGLVGSTLLLLLFVILLMRGVKIAMEARDFLGSIICMGIVTLLASQTFINLGMTVGIMPVTGLPLPFLSYGGSCLLTMMVFVGLLLNVRMRTHMF